MLEIVPSYVLSLTFWQVETGIEIGIGSESGVEPGLMGEDHSSYQRNGPIHLVCPLHCHLSQHPGRQKMVHQVSFVWLIHGRTQQQHALAHCTLLINHETPRTAVSLWTWAWVFETLDQEQIAFA